MAKPMYSFQQLIADRHSYEVDQTAPNPELHRRYVRRNNWLFFESGRIELALWADRNPDDRDRASRAMGVLIALADSLPPLMTYEGEKIPKTWLVGNPALLWDKEYNVVLPASGRTSVVYPSPEAQPYTSSTTHYSERHAFITYTKPHPDEVKKRLKDEALVTTYQVARAAYRCASGEKAPGHEFDGLRFDMRMWLYAFVREPKAYADLPEHTALALGALTETGFKQLVKEACKTEEKVAALRVITN